MSTRSLIGVLNPDGTVTSIYCHSDGYFSYNGAVLLEHYTEEEKVRELIGLGSISSLDKEIGRKHSFNGSSENWVRAYHRDRGEDWSSVSPRTNQTVTEYFESGKTCWAEYLYLFNPATKQWFADTIDQKRKLADGTVPRLSMTDCVRNSSSDEE